MSTDIDRRIDRLTSQTATTTVGRLDLWVDDDTGSDENPGTEQLPLATLTEAVSRVPDHVKSPVVIHLLPHTGAGYAWAPILGKVMSDNLWIVGEGFTELLTTQTATAGTGSNAVVDPTGGFTIDVYVGKTIEILSGAAAGTRRLIKSNTADTFVPSSPFSPAPADGDSYRVVEPSVYVTLDSSLPNTVLAENCLGSVILPNIPDDGLRDGSSYIGLVNFRFNLTNIGGSYDLHLNNATIAMFGVESVVEDISIVCTPASTCAMGLDLVGVAVGPTKDLGVTSDTAWRGWGLATHDLGINFVGGNTTGFYCSAGAVVVRNGSHFVLGTRVLGDYFIGTDLYPGGLCRVYMQAGTLDGVVVVEGFATLATFLTVTIDSTGVGLTATKGAKVRVTNVTSITADGSSAGILASQMATVAIGGSTSVTTSGNETEVVDGEGTNITRTIAGYAGVDDYISAGGTTIMRVV